MVVFVVIVALVCVCHSQQHCYNNHRYRTLWFDVNSWHRSKYLWSNCPWAWWYCRNKWSSFRWQDVVCVSAMFGVNQSCIFCIYTEKKTKFLHRPRSVAMELIPCRHFEPVRVKPNYASIHRKLARWADQITAITFNQTRPTCLVPGPNVMQNSPFLP